MTVLLVAAERREFVGLERRCRKIKRHSWGLQYASEADCGGNRFVMVADGAGPKLARQAAETGLKRNPATLIVSTGFCGGLDPALRVAEVFVATSVQGRKRFMTASSSGQGVLLSVDRVIGRVSERAELFAQGYAAVEMESAGVAETAEAHGLGFLAIRVVSDTASHELSLDLNEMRDRDGRFQVPKIVATALRSPLRVGRDLRRLQKQSAMAAEALGEYLANNDF